MFRIIFRCSKYVYKFYDFNHLYSNISYILFGICFMFFVWFKVWWLKRRRRRICQISSTVYDNRKSPVQIPDHDVATLDSANVTAQTLVCFNSEDVHDNSGVAANHSNNVSTDETDRSIGTNRGPLKCNQLGPDMGEDSIKITVTEPDMGVMQQFGIYYALGLALIFQGCFSICYHICPTSMSLQFDTTTMYIICTLGLIKFYQVTK